MQGFRGNNRGIANGADIPDAVLDGIYDRLKADPISLKEDDDAVFDTNNDDLDGAGQEDDAEAEAALNAFNSGQTSQQPGQQPTAGGGARRGEGGTGAVGPGGYSAGKSL